MCKGGAFGWDGITGNFPYPSNLLRELPNVVVSINGRLNSLVHPGLT